MLWLRYFSSLVEELAGLGHREANAEHVEVADDLIFRECLASRALICLDEHVPLHHPSLYIYPNDTTLLKAQLGLLVVCSYCSACCVVDHVCPFA